MKKVLIITYYWPPAGGPGVQRWLKFVQYLPYFGIEPVVYAPQNPRYPIIDSSLEATIPGGITVVKHPIAEPYRLASFFARGKINQMSRSILPEKKQSLTEKILLWIRGNLFIPDARKFWVKPSVRFLTTYLEKAGIDTVITTGPPHSLHLIGLHLKKRMGVKWLADFRDPWTSISYHDKLQLTAFSKQRHKKLEKEVLQTANHIVVTTRATCADFALLTSVPISVIPNGYDVLPIGEAPVTGKFTLSHIGSLLTGRNPRLLWEVLGQWAAADTAFKDDFCLQLAGTVSQEVLEIIYACGLFPNTHLLGYVNHDRAVELQQRSQVLLLLETDSENMRGIVPGKVFEYMASGRPVLAVGPSEWEVEGLLAETATGRCFTYRDKEGLKNHLEELYRTFKQGALQTQPIGLEAYHRKNLTGLLAGIIRDL